MNAATLCYSALLRIYTHIYQYYIYIYIIADMWYQKYQIAAVITK